jgi:uncharacterized protein YdhG (YjbR/CyaY superfamily)
MAKTDFTSIDDYLASRPASVRRVLARVRSTIRKALPRAEEVISYQIPAYRLNGRVVVYFAGWSEHYSVYPVGDRAAAAIGDDLARYKAGRGTVRFPLSEPVPAGLIARIAKQRAKEVAERTGAKARAVRKRRAR